MKVEATVRFPKDQDELQDVLRAMHAGETIIVSLEGKLSVVTARDDIDEIAGPGFSFKKPEMTWEVTLMEEGTDTVTSPEGNVAPFRELTDGMKVMLEMPDA